MKTVDPLSAGTVGTWNERSNNCLLTLSLSGIFYQFHFSPKLAYGKHLSSTVGEQKHKCKTKKIAHFRPDVATIFSSP